MLKVKNNGNLIIISGPSGAGKGTICKELIRRNENIIPSISFTSRSIANGEKEGVDYFYISKQEFENKIKEGFFLEYAIVHNNDYYGTPKDKVLEYLNKGYNVILEIDIEGALKVKEIMRDVLCIFILPPSMKELRQQVVGLIAARMSQVVGIMNSVLSGVISCLDQKAEKTQE